MGIILAVSLVLVQNSPTVVRPYKIIVDIFVWVQESITGWERTTGEKKVAFSITCYVNSNYIVTYMYMCN